MQISKVRAILWLIGGVAAAGAVVTIVAVAVLPLGVSDDGTTQASSKLIAHDGLSPTTLPLASFAQAWQMPLRRPLVDAPVPTSADNSIPAGSSAPAVRLIGTIVDGQHARGIFMTGLVTIEMKTVGDTIGAAKILTIDDDSATLSSDTGTITLHREKKPFDPSGENYNAPPPASTPSEGKDALE